MTEKRINVSAKIVLRKLREQGWREDEIEEFFSLQLQGEIEAADALMDEVEMRLALLREFGFGSAQARPSLGSKN
jgi:hypothetical protein